jgi:hypothetical protein
VTVDRFDALVVTTLADAGLLSVAQSDPGWILDHRPGGMLTLSVQGSSVPPAEQKRLLGAYADVLRKAGLHVTGFAFCLYVAEPREGLR